MSSDIHKQTFFRFIGDALRPFKLSLCIMLWVAIFWAFDLSMRRYLVGVLIDRVIESNGQDVFSHVKWPALFYLSMQCCMTSLFRVRNYFVEIQMIPKLRTHIANLAGRMLLAKNHSFFQDSFSGNLASKVMDLTAAIPELLQITIDQFLGQSLAIIFAIITLSFVSPTFGILMFLWASLFILFSLFFSKVIVKRSRIWSSLGNKISGQIVDIFSNMLSIRLFNARNRELDNLDHILNEATLAEQNLQWATLYFWALFGFSFLALQALNFYFLLVGLDQGSITVGDFALVWGINLAAADFIVQLGKDISQFARLRGKTEQALADVFSTASHSQTIRKDLRVTMGAIEVRNILFKYRGAEPIFNDLSFTIKSGEKIGLVGYSGSGKTTLVNLLLGLYEISSGTILIDGQDIALHSKHSLRDAIAMIPQDPSLFNRTLMDNIRLGKANATDQEVILASKKAYADDFISHMVNGYASVVGERGVKLSGGQRQRIAIARAILKNAPILILDEATSQLDSVAEQKIQASLKQLMHNKTTIIIAHRLSTLLHMDRILVFDEGKIVEDGPHHVLIQQHGLYSTLWHTQVGGLLPERKPNI